MRTSLISLRLSLAGFIVPFIFVYEPAMLLINPDGLPTNATEFPLASLADALIVAVSTSIAVIAISAAVEGYIKTNMNVITRIVLGIGAILLVVPEIVTDMIGYALIIGIYVINYIQGRKEPPTPSQMGKSYSG